MDTYREGHALIAAGKVGCIVLAGGDGSRLGWDGPKGSFPLSLIKQKSLFQMLQERVEAASHYFGRNLKLAVMTSPLNHEETMSAFSRQVDFFSQNLLPLLDMEGNPLEEMRPNGNGQVLQCFYRSGLFEKWREAGIEFVQVILIDNPLAEPFDLRQIGVHFTTGAEVTVKAVQKISPEEKVGVIGEKEGKICIIEYSENPPQEWNLANTGLFSFSMDFIEKVKEIELPLHSVKRLYQGKPVIKRECFFFDILSYAEKTEVILYPREKIFAPLKNRDDVAFVQKVLLERDRQAFLEICGNPVSEQIFELDAAFHYPTERLKAKWKGRSLPEQSYVES